MNVAAFRKCNQNRYRRLRWNKLHTSPVNSLALDSQLAPCRCHICVSFVAILHFAWCYISGDRLGRKHKNFTCSNERDSTSKYPGCITISDFTFKSSDTGYNNNNNTKKNKIMDGDTEQAFIDLYTHDVLLYKWTSYQCCL